MHSDSCFKTLNLAICYSIGSMATPSEQNSCSMCSSRNDFDMAGYCSRCQSRIHQQHCQRSHSTATDPDGAVDQVKVVVTSETPTATPPDNFSYPFLTPRRTPEPVGARLKSSNLDVLAVDYAPGRSPSIYSTGSEGNYDLDNEVFSKVNGQANGDAGNFLRPIPGIATIKIFLAKIINTHYS